MWFPLSHSPLVKSAYRKFNFLFLNQNICCGYSKEPSQWDGSFEHPKHMLKLMGQKIYTCLRWNECFCLSKPVGPLLKACLRCAIFTWHTKNKFVWKRKSSENDSQICGKYPHPEQTEIRTNLLLLWIFLLLLSQRLFALVPIVFVDCCFYFWCLCSEHSVLTKIRLLPYHSFGTVWVCMKVNTWKQATSAGDVFSWRWNNSF